MALETEYWQPYSQENDDERRPAACPSDELSADAFDVLGVHCRDPRHQDGDLQNGASAV
ncbi:hypothetical protein D3C72_2494230 [compost metagenome]